METVLHVLFMILVGFALLLVIVDICISRIRAPLYLKRNEKRMREQCAMYAKAKNEWEAEQEKQQTLYWKAKDRFPS